MAKRVPPGDQSRRTAQCGATAPVRETHERENCRGRNLLGEASIPAAEEAVIQCGTLLVALVALTRFAVNLDFTSVIDMVVGKNAFLTGSSFKAPAQQERYIRSNTHAFLCSPACGHIGDVPFNLDPSQIAHF